jgi:T5SS/PEP-CTERM-associated repeat protein/autotransporter-associated beta strand protein
MKALRHLPRKGASTEPRRTGRRRRAICASAIALFLASVGDGYSFSRFKFLTGDWLTPANWQNGLPTAATDSTQILSGSTVTVSGAGAVAGPLSLGVSTSDGGNVIITGAGVLTVSSLNVTGGGGVTVQNGGSFNSGGFNFIGSGVGNTSLTITGAGSIFNQSGGALYLGGTGITQTTTISAGGVLTSSGAITLAEGGTSAMTVTGTNSKLTSTASLTIGGQASTIPANGTLTISAGGQVSNTSALLGAFNSRGAVTVTDAGSRWDNTGTVFVGTANTNTGGTLLVQNGAAGSSGGLNVGVLNGLASSVTFTGNGTSWINTGTFNLNSGTTLDMTAGAQFSSSGQANLAAATTTTISGTGSSWSNPNFMNIRANAVVKVLNGAAATNGGISIQQGASGSVTVSGIGTTWSAGQVSVGSATTTDPVGTTPGLLVSGGAAMSVSNLLVSGGTLRVTGTNSSLSTLTATSTTMGQTAPSFVSIDTGGTLSTTGATANIAVGAAGTVSITGAGSTWNADAITMGQSALATMNVTAGGKVASTSAVLGVSTAASGSRGVVLISGANSQWNAGTLTVGKAGTAAITVDTGGTLLSSGSALGDASGGSGDVIVTGAGSQWTSGALSILNGSTVTVADGANLTVGGGTGAITLASGLGNTTAQKLNIGSGGLAGTISASSISSNGSVNFNFTDSVNWNIPISGFGSVTKAGSGTLTLSTANTFYAGFTATGGTVRAANPLALSGNLSFSNTTLILANDAGASFLDPGNAFTNTTFSTDGTIVSDRVTPGPGVTQSLGTFTFGGTTLNVTAGPNVTSGTAGFTVSSITISNPVNFNVGSGAYLGLNSYSNPAGIVKTGAGTLAIGLIFGQPTNAITINGGAVLEQAGFYAAAPQIITVNATSPGTTASYNLDNISHAIQSLTLGGAGGASTSRNNVDTGDSTLFVNGNITFDATSNPLGSFLSGAVYFNAGGHSITVGNSTNAAAGLTISADIIGGSFTKDGPGVLALSGDNFFANGITVAAGTLQASTEAGALGGTGSLTLSGGALDLHYDTDILSEARLVLTADATITASHETPGLGTNFTFDTFNPGAHTLSFSVGANVTGGTSKLTFGFTNFNGNAVLNPAAGTEISMGEIRNGASAGSLTKTGLGTVLLTDDNSYSGQTAVEAGKVIVSGSLTGSVLVDPDAIFASGHNLISTTGPIVVTSDSLSGGTLGPGDTGGPGLSTIGRLNINGALTLGAAATTGQAHLTLEIGGLVPGTEYDQITLTGPISLFDVRLDLALLNNFAPPVGSRFYLLTGATALSGTFSNQSAPDGASGGLPIFLVGQQEFAISYQANAAQGTLTGGHDVALLVIVPEPTSAALLLSSVALLACRRRRRVAPPSCTHK